MTEPPSRNPDGFATGSGRRPFLWLLVILVAVYLPLFLGRIIFTRDIAHYAFPLRAFLRESFARGEFPLWNPYQGLGIPAFSQPQYGVFYPLNWLLFLVGPAQVASVFNWQSFLHMAWGAAGVCWLARRLGASSKGIVIAGLAWALSGYTTAEWISGMRLAADAWVPWAAVGQVALLDSLRAGGRAWRRGICKAALPSLFAVLYGEVFLAMVGAGFGVLFAIAVQASERIGTTASPRTRVRWLLASVLAVVLAFAAGAIVIVPARALLGSSERAAPLPRTIAEACSLHPLRLVEFAAPTCMGDVYGDYPAARVVGEPSLDGLPLSYSIYLGASVIVLVLAAFGRGRRQALVLGALAGLALLLALGKYTPVHGIFRRIVFPLAYMRFPEKYMVAIVAVVAVLAGLGAQRVLSGNAQPWRRTAVFLALLVALGAASPFLFPYPWSGFMVQGLRHGAAAVLALLGIQFLAARRSRLAAPMLVATVALDLTISTLGLQGFVPSVLASNVPYSVRVVKTDHGARHEPPRIYRSPATDHALARASRVSSPAEGELRLLGTSIPNTVNAWGIATLPGYDAAIPARMSQLWDRGRTDRLAALRLLGADYVVLPVGDPSAAGERLDGLEPLADPVPGARIFRVTGSLPPVFLAGRGEALADDEALRRMFEPQVIAGEVAWLAPQANALPGQPGPAGTCALTSYTHRRLEARCQATRAGLAVFVEQYDPGWHATVDGRPAPVLRANLVMRAVPLEPGDHLIVLEYHAPGVKLGIAISILALAVMLSLAIGSTPRSLGTGDGLGV